MSSGESGLKVTAPTYARQNFDYRNDVGAEDMFSSGDSGICYLGVEPTHIEATYGHNNMGADEASVPEEISPSFGVEKNIV